MKGPRARWAVCGLLFGATLLNYLDRQTLAVAAPLLREELALDLSGLGLVFAAFYWSYALGQVLVGFLLDRVPMRLAYAAAVAAWSLAGAAAALATGLWSLLVLRVALGLAEAANWPAAMRVVSQQFEPAERSLANGIFQSGTSVGALLAPPLLIFVAARHGWRLGFAAVGVLGFVWVAAWLLFYRDRPTPAPAPRASAAPVSLGTLLRGRRLLGLLLASAFLNPCLYFYVNWLPTYFVSAGTDFGGRLAGMLFVAYLTLDLGYLSAGALVLRLSLRVGVTRARRLMAALGVPLMGGILFVPLLRDPYAVTAVAALATLGLGWFMVNYLAFAEEVSHARVATVSGILGAAGSMSGALLMWLVGVISDATGRFDWPFVIVGLMPLVALAGLLWATAGPPQPWPSTTSATVTA